MLILKSLIHIHSEMLNKVKMIEKNTGINMSNAKNIISSKKCTGINTVYIYFYTFCQPILCVVCGYLFM